MVVKGQTYRVKHMRAGLFVGTVEEIHNETSHGQNPFVSTWATLRVDVPLRAHRIADRLKPLKAGETILIALERALLMPFVPEVQPAA